MVTGIASLGLDHQAFLGNRLVDVAYEKAGIAKRGVPLVTQRYPPALAARVKQVADDKGAMWEPRGLHWDAIARSGNLRYRDRAGELSLPLPRLPGRHQAMNAALAVAMLRHQRDIDVPAAAYSAAMGWANWPARLQKLQVGPLLEMLPRGSELWIDGGHNPAAARLIAAHARRNWNGDLPLVLLFASLTSKDASAVLQPFRGIASQVFTLPIEGHECRDPAELANMATQMGFVALPKRSISEALIALRKRARVLAFGSLYLAGEALSLNGTVPD